MYKVIIWGTGISYNMHYHSLKLQELMGALQVLAVTSSDKDLQNKFDDYLFLPKEEALALNYDYCLLAVDNGSKLEDEVAHLGLSKKKTIPIQVLSEPHFDFDKYILLRQSNLSIFSSNCWAGICYNRMGLDFLSPTINMFFSLEDFNKFMGNLDYYLSLPVEFAEMCYESNFKRDYPVAMIGDIRLNFNHDTDFANASANWERRKKRVNPCNILVVSYTDSPKIAEEFDALPYVYKIIFTSFYSDLLSSYFIHKDDLGQLWAPVNQIAKGSKNIFNMLSFLNHEDNWKRTC